MKKHLLILFLFLVSTIIFSQPMMREKNELFQIRHNQTLKKEKLMDAKFISDIISHVHPAQWDKNIELLSTEFFTSTNGKTISANGKNDTLTPEQKSILQTAVIGNELGIKIKLKYPQGDKQELSWLMTIVAEKEAKYPGGQEKLIKYFQKTVLDKLEKPIDIKQVWPAVAKFTINEKGELTDIEIIEAAPNPKVNELFLEALKKMPNWEPAENSKGEKIKQTFSIPVPLHGC